MRYLIYFLIAIILLSGCKSASSSKGKSAHRQTMKAKSKMSRSPRKARESAEGDIVMSPAPEPSHDYAISQDTAVDMSVGSAYEERVVESAEISYEASYEIPKAIIVDKTKDAVKSPEENFTKGLVAYSVPSEMTVGENYFIKIRITKDVAEKKTLIVGDHEIPISDTTVNSTITIESIRVSSIMSAALTSDSDDNFKITSKSTETQNIENFGYTEWEWGVMPLKSGDHNLKLVIKVRITSSEGSFFKDIVVFEKHVAIKSNASYSISKFVEKYWQWSLSTLIIPFFIWLYNRKKKKKEETQKDPS